LLLWEIALRIPVALTSGQPTSVTEVRMKSWQPYGVPVRLTCVRCGGEFTARHPLALYCSYRCRNDAYIERRRERRAASFDGKKTCGVCGEEFTAARSDAKTCSAACRQKAYRRRRNPMRVVHVKSGEPYDVYIGRANPRNGLKKSVWANPFKIDEDGTREEVIEKYERCLLNERPDLVARLPELRGKVLGCWCAPEPCHGDVLIRLAENSL
jgi:predicted nucleic acid-binding Zn ribbon protein